MSASANLDLVRSIYGAWERGDWDSTDWADPEIECRFADGPALGDWRGVTGLRQCLHELLNPWEQWRTRADAYRELDDERVLVLDHFSGRGATSGVDMEEMRTEGAVLFHLRRSKVTRLVLYWSRGRALSDVGLSSGTASSSS